MEIVKVLLSDEHYLTTFGILECNFFYLDIEENHRVSHRDFFIKDSKFQNILDLSDNYILSQIGMSHRLKYLRDCVLAHLLSEKCVLVVNASLDIVNQNIIFYIKVYL